MNFKSKQAIFDYVGAFLFKQAVQSKNGNGSCQYRGPNKTMCAVGCIIPDKFYSSNFESLSVSGLIKDHDFIIPWYIKRYAKFLDEFQIFHDAAHNWNETGLKVDRLIAFGKRHKLDTSKFQ